MEMSRRGFLKAAALTVSAMGFGCMSVNDHRSEHPDEAACIRLVHEAIEHGGTLFDTAESNGPFTNEVLMGKASKGGGLTVTIGDYKCLSYSFRQYSDGVTPSCFLNIRLRCWEYSKPRRSDTWETVSPAASPFLASWMTNWRI